MKKAIIYVAFLILLIAVVAGVLMYNKPHRAVQGEDPDFKLSVSELVTPFSTDETAANARYAGRIVEVHGKVKEMIPNEGSPVLLIGDSAEPIAVICYLRGEERDKYTPLAIGELVTVKGICNGMLLDVVIDEAILIE